MHASIRSSRWLAALAVTVTIAATACSGSEAGAKAGGPAAPVVLRIGTNDFQGRPGADQIEEFVRQVAALSDGQIEIEPVWHAAGDGPDWDQRVARLVVGGELDMGMIPTRSWDTEGVTTLRALNTPFLVTGDALVAEIVSSELADDLMSGLDQVGVVGLALLPEGLRHPFGYDHPLLSPDDFAGETIRMPTSATAAVVIEALGATPTDDEFDAATQVGAESAYILDPVGTYATGNVTLYPKVNSLVINAEAFDALSDDQRETIRQAATRTRDWAVEHTPSDAELAARWCRDGKGVALASNADLDALRSATEPVVVGLESDETTASLIERLRVLSSSDEPSVQACEPVEASGAEDGAKSAAELDGVYRFEVTDDEIAEVGLPPEAARENTGTFTITIDGDRWCYDLAADHEISITHYCDRAAIVDDVLVLSGNDQAAPTAAELGWEVVGDGALDMTVIGSIPEQARPFVESWTFEPWTRIGDVEDADSDR